MNQAVKVIKAFNVPGLSITRERLAYLTERAFRYAKTMLLLKVDCSISRLDVDHACREHVTFTNQIQRPDVILEVGKLSL